MYVIVKRLNQDPVIVTVHNSGEVHWLVTAKDVEWAQVISPSGYLVELARPENVAQEHVHLRLGASIAPHRPGKHRLASVPESGANS